MINLVIAAAKLEVLSLGLLGGSHCLDACQKINSTLKITLIVCKLSLS